MAWIETLPLYAAGLVVLAALVVAMELGNRLGRRLHRGTGRPKAPDHLLSAVLGLLALLLGFTFSLALGRHEDRRALVMQEANAIGTLRLRAQLIVGPERERVVALIDRYLDERLEWSEVASDEGALERAAALQTQLWAEAGQLVSTAPDAQLTRGLFEAMNESFDLASAREAARGAHLPERVINVLLIYMALSALMLGYMGGSGGTPHRAATTMLLALLVLALVLILDLDRPREGSIKVPQTPMETLRAGLE